MLFDAAGTSRSEALRTLLAEFDKPIGWKRLAEIAAELAAASPNLAPERAPIPPGARERLLGKLPAPSDPPQGTLQVRAGLFAMLLLLDLCAEGVAGGLASAVRDIAAQPDATSIFPVLGRFLTEAGFRRELSPDLLGPIDARGAPLDDAAIDTLLAALRFLGLAKTTPYPSRRDAFYELVLPRMRAAAAAGDIDTLLSIEGMAYEEYVKSVETPEHGTESFAAIEAVFAAVGSEPAPPRTSLEGRRPRVAFLVFNGHLLAHAEVLLTFLAGLAKLDEPYIEPLVFIHGAPTGQALGQRLDAMGVRWEAMGFATPYGYQAHYRKVRARLAELGADAAVFVSLPKQLAYFCRRPLAPVQIWWSMKFPLPNFEGLDGRVFYRSLFDRTLQIEGRLWRGGPLAIAPPRRPDPAAVQAIRDRYPGKTILGTIAREEKLANAEYLDAVAGVLQRHPDACFLWTGRRELREVRDAFARAGVADRCHFVGWVDPAPHLMAFDLFLETYPLTGLMSGWAMALGQPIVSVGPLGFVGNYLGPVLDGDLPAEPEDLARIARIFAPVADRLPGLWARGPEQIGAFADALLADPDLRRDLGGAQQAYVEAFMLDEAGSAAAQARHFADIVRESQKA